MSLISQPWASIHFFPRRTPTIAPQIAALQSASQPKLNASPQHFLQIVAAAVQQGADHGGRVELVAVAVALPSPVMGVLLLDAPARLAPFLRVLLPPREHVRHDRVDHALRIDRGQARPHDRLHVLLEERGRDHRREELRRLDRLAVDRIVGVVDADLRRRARHARRDQAEGLADELRRDVEHRPGIDRDPPADRRIDPEVEQLAGIEVRTPDAPVHVGPPELRDPLRRNKSSPVFCISMR